MFVTFARPINRLPFNGGERPLLADSSWRRANSPRRGAASLRLSEDQEREVWTMAFTSGGWPNPTDLAGCDELCIRPAAAEPRAAPHWRIVGIDSSSPFMAAIEHPRADGRRRPRSEAPIASADAVKITERCSHTDQSFVPPTRGSEWDPVLVRRLKSAVLDGPRFDAAEADIARELGLSGRTLRRRLRELGTTYAEILAEARFAFAKRCLADASLTICDVADRAGYSEVSNFRIAFKRWANCSPHMFRAELGLNPNQPDQPNPDLLSDHAAGACSR